MSKTRVNRKLPSVEELIRKHSTARYLRVSRHILALFIEPALRRSAVSQQVQKYC